MAYFVKDFEQDSNLAFFNRVVSDIEEHPDYIHGETEIVFVGRPTSSLVAPSGLEDVHELHAIATQHLLTPTYYFTYFEYVLERPTKFPPYEVWIEYEQKAEVKQMPVYPQKGSIKTVDDRLVIRLG